MGSLAEMNHFGKDQRYSKIQSQQFYSNEGPKRFPHHLFISKRSFHNINSSNHSKSQFTGWFFIFSSATSGITHLVQ